MPVYEEVPGWSRPIADVRDWSDLPPETISYLERISELTGCAIGLASNGADRRAILRPPSSPIDDVLK